MQPLEVVLANGSAAERRVRGWLEELLREHSLERWLFCRHVVIDDHSSTCQARISRGGQPEIVLYTGFRSPLGLLALFIHEQLHVHLSQHPAGVEAAVEELRALYPTVPVGGGQGAQSERSTYEHLLLCRLEQDALTELLDREVVARLRPSGYQFIYREVARNAAVLQAINRRHGLNVP